MQVIQLSIQFIWFYDYIQTFTTSVLIVLTPSLPSPLTSVYDSANFNTLRSLVKTGNGLWWWMVTSIICTTMGQVLFMPNREQDVSFLQKWQKKGSSTNPWLDIPTSFVGANHDMLCLTIQLQLNTTHFTHPTKQEIEL